MAAAEVVVWRNGESPCCMLFDCDAGCRGDGNTRSSSVYIHAYSLSMEDGGRLSGVGWGIVILLTDSAVVGVLIHSFPSLQYRLAWEWVNGRGDEDAGDGERGL